MENPWRIPFDMKLPYLLTVCSSLCLAPLVFADDTPLAEQMSEMNDAYKAFRRTKDAVEGASQARTAQAILTKSMLETPELVKKMADGPDKAKALAKYRHMTGQLYVKLCEVEMAFLEGKIDDVPALIDELKDLKKKGHDQFMED